eukprot:gene6464-11914_t
MKELEENPFRDRIYHVFSTDQVDSLNFDEFLDMHSVFNSQAPSGIKIAYLFKIYDMDNDSKLGRNDLLAVLDRITDSSLETSERNEIIDKIFEESNWNGDDVLDFYEFEQVLAKAPYFLRFSFDETARSYHVDVVCLFWKANKPFKHMEVILSVEIRIGVPALPWRRTDKEYENSNLMKPHGYSSLQ